MVIWTNQAFSRPPLSHVLHPYFYAVLSRHIVMVNMEKSSFFKTASLSHCITPLFHATQHVITTLTVTHTSTVKADIVKQVIREI